VAFCSNKENTILIPDFEFVRGYFKIISELECLPKIKSQLSFFCGGMGGLKSGRDRYKLFNFAEKNNDITNSITYAKRIQDAILPSKKYVNKYLPSSFVLYKPKDIVAGDFFWFEHVNGISFIAAADCTGHGVPGALVSVVCSNALNRAVLEFGLTDTGKILDKTRELVLETFSRSDEDVKDGMDISLCGIKYSIDSNVEISWSGANNPLWYIDKEEMKEIKAHKQPIGKTESPEPFPTNKLNLKKQDTIYLFTDGYADQFGGEKGKKFKYKQLQELIFKNSSLSPEIQLQKLDETFETWRGPLEQVDDVCVIGIRL
jgi:serine phosphatase RsbU (regulator of sigma subunit)